MNKMENEENIEMKDYDVDIKRIDKDIKKITKLIDAINNKLTKAVKNIPDECDYDLINNTIENKIQEALDNASEIKDYIDEKINLLNNEAKKDFNALIKRIKTLEPIEIIKKTIAETKKEILKYPEFIIDAFGIKKKFLKINRTTKEPIYQ